MPITVLATKIKVNVKSDSDNFKRVSGLSEYVAMPESKAAKEKCVALRAYGFSVVNPSVEDIKNELAFDMMQARIKSNELLSHWVMSWNGGEPKEEEMFSAARELMVDLGYTDFHKQVYSIQPTQTIRISIFWAARLTHGKAKFFVRETAGGKMRRASRWQESRINSTGNLKLVSLFMFRPIRVWRLLRCLHLKGKNI